VLVRGNNVDMIISRVTIHQGEDFSSGTVIDDLVDKVGRKVVFRTNFFNVPIINTHADGALFLVNWNKIRNPVN